MKRPNFTGTWKFNPSKSVLQIHAPDSTVLAIDHREPIFRLSRTHTVGKTSDTFALDLTTDGTEVTVERDNMMLRARARWAGDTLVFHTTLIQGGVDASNIVKYKLTGIDSLVADECFRSKTLSYDNIWMLDRQ